MFFEGLKRDPVSRGPTLRHKVEICGGGWTDDNIAVSLRVQHNGDNLRSGVVQLVMTDSELATFVERLTSLSAMAEKENPDA